MPFYQRKFIKDRRIGHLKLPENWWYAGNFELLNHPKIVFCWTKPGHTPVAEKIGFMIIEALAQTGGVLLVCHGIKLSRVLIERAGQKGVPFILLEPRMASAPAEKVHEYQRLLQRYNGVIINVTNCQTHTTNVLPWMFYPVAAFLAHAMVIVDLAVRGAHRDLQLFAEAYHGPIWLPALPAGVRPKAIGQYLRSLRYYRDLPGFELIGLERLQQQLAKL